MTLFIITLPAIGLSERYGLQEQAANLIRKIRAATVGRLQIIYQLFRVLHGLMGIRLNGHPSFVRPLIFPMSVGAARTRFDDAGVSEQAVEKSRARTPPLKITATSTARICRRCRPEFCWFSA